MAINSEYLERKRRIALQDSDALNFAKYCDLSGTMPEDRLLYEEGKAQFLYEQGIKESKDPRTKESGLEKIAEREFLKKGARLNLQNYESQADYKRDLLIEHFPIKFGPYGIQPIKDYTPAKVGFLFRNVYLSYKKKEKKK